MIFMALNSITNAVHCVFYRIYLTIVIGQTVFHRAQVRLVRLASRRAHPSLLLLLLLLQTGHPLAEVLALALAQPALAELALVLLLLLLLNAALQGLART